MNAPVEIAAYDPCWPGIFTELRDQITSALGPLAHAIEHVGSTAIPGLAAKPIIDIDVVISSPADLPAVITKLRPLGYHPEGDLGVPGREAFTTPPGTPPHHLYVCVAGSAPLERHLALRDLLRARPDLTRAYAALKRSLADQYRNDRTAYTNGKTTFIEQALAAAAASQSQADPPQAFDGQAERCHGL